ncbi:hypothetical protein Dsin_028689 [Dipteronia sinensis]|uniref:Uncharacterized protein n=1 Tax=Dipteronia sinensis TaxID=43782 RepID=A0AAE0DUH7_9ROSI|nr:hypothetical protein Dsin_028689 [Dipteronia sinensis]
MAEPQPLPEFSGKRRLEDGERAKSRDRRRAKAQDSGAVETDREETKVTVKIADAIRCDVPVVLKALVGIECQFRVNPPQQVISISSTYDYSAVRPIQPYVDPTSGWFMVGKVNKKQRHIQFGGSIQQVALAKQWIGEYIYSQLIQHAGAQQ